MRLPAPATTDTPMGGLKRSAMLMRALGARASAVWAELSEHDAQKLTAAMQALPEDDQAEQDALSSFVDKMQTRDPDRVMRSGGVWDLLSEHDGVVISNLIRRESPQVIAVILSRMTPETSAQTVRTLPRALATEALKRLLNMGDVHPAAITALELSLQKRLQGLADNRSNNGHENVARIFDRLDTKSEQSLMSSLESAQPGASEKIRALMFTFEDLAALDPASLQTILLNVERSVLTIALKRAPEAVSTVFYQNMTQRAAELLREEIDASGPVRRREIEAARGEIITIARTLVKRGDILSRDEDDELVE